MPDGSNSASTAEMSGVGPSGSKPTSNASGGGSGSSSTNDNTSIFRGRTQQPSRRDGQECSAAAADAAAGSASWSSPLRDNNNDDEGASRSPWLRQTDSIYSPPPQHRPRHTAAAANATGTSPAVARQVRAQAAILQVSRVLPQRKLRNWILRDVLS